jgi:hypothetical protein
VGVRPEDNVYSIHFLHRSDSKKGATLTAVHLVIIAKDESIFGANDVAEVLKLLQTPTAPDAVTIFGCIDVWENPENRVLPAFQKLTGTLKTLKKYQQYTKEEGRYGASIHNDDIEIRRE